MAIVPAVGVAVPKRSGFGLRIEAAMRKAVQDALDQGISNPNAIKGRIIAARNKAKRDLKQD